MDPGSVIPDLIRDRGDGLLKESGSSPAFFRHSGLDPESILSQRDGGRVAGSGGMSPVTFRRSTWTPGQARGDGLLKESGSLPAVTGC
jgi:hypothetical protein